MVARQSGGSMKTSFHESGLYQTSFNSKFVEKLKKEGNWWRESRHIDQWRQTSNIGKGITLAFRIVIPSSQLRTMPFLEKKEIVWISPPEQGFTTEIAILFCNSRHLVEGWPGQRSLKTNLLLHHLLPNGKTLWIVYREDKDTEGTLQRIQDLKRVIMNQPPTYSKQGAHINITTARLLLGGEEADGSRFILDIAGDTIFS
jgi:hypothetical protein